MNHFDMELTQRQANEYRRAIKKRKGEIITQYCRLTGASRNLASKRFRKAIRNVYPQTFRNKGKNKKLGKKRGRKPKYTIVHKTIIKKIWKLSGEICGERRHPALGEYIRQLEENGKLKSFRKQSIRETDKISEPTLKRIIAQFPRTGSRGKRKGNLAIYKAIPIQAYFGKNAYQSGYVEIDYVEHNGGNSSGTFANTGSYVDVCLGWTVRAAALGKHLKGVAKIHDKNETKIFHQIHEYHPDNAKPILKLLLEKTLGEKPAGYRVSRSRPYHKEDNGHVEQKNGDKVRKLVGYHRYDTEKQVELLNRLYDIEDLISNFFLPSQKLVEKVKDSKGRVVRRRYDQARTAYQRLLEARDIDEKVKKRVKKMYNQPNLVELRNQSEKLQQQLFRTVI